ncbi:uncharacterized protein [Miscanthus floridulus]|uniref:uncharacterized protein n=1 Tax=Miscanthus floridulus TaxID=154761 RepID=UPI003459E495
MQPVCRLRLAPARAQPEVQRARAGTGTTCQPRRATTSHGVAWCLCVAPARRLRARAPCGGGATEPVEARKDGPAPAVDQADKEAELVPEELEVLEEAAITGDDEGRRPTDYDRRAHIFEESSRVFRELKKRSDGGGGSGSESGRGGVTTGAPATAAETRACNEQQQ